MNLLEILIIGIPSFFLSLQPNKSRVEGRFLNYVIRKSLPSAVLMVLSVGAIEIFKLILGNAYSDNVYQTLSVYALTFSGLINLAVICKPLNKYRTVLLSLTAVALIGVFLTTVFVGLPMLGFAKLSPISDYYKCLLLILGIIVIDFPLAFGIQKLFNKLLKIKK